MSLELDQIFRYRNYPSPVKGRGRRWQHTHTHTCCMKSTLSSNLLYDQSQFKIRTFHHPDLGKLMYEHIYIFVHGCLYIYIIYMYQNHTHHIIQTITNLIYQYINIYMLYITYTHFCSNSLSLWSLTYFTSKLGKAKNLPVSPRPCPSITPWSAWAFPTRRSFWWWRRWGSPWIWCCGNLGINRFLQRSSRLIRLKHKMLFWHLTP